MLEILALSNSPIPTMKRVLNMMTSKYYDGDLLYRFSKKIRDSKFGNESLSIIKFMDLGAGIRANGGLFMVDFCEASTKINAVYVQHRIESDLVKCYGKHLFYLDSTHNTTRYVLKAVPPQSIDCFGFTCPLGLCLIPSESHDYARSVVFNLGLNNPGCTVVTDRAPAWSVPLDEIEARHIYDTFHFNRDIQTHKSDQHDKFMLDMRMAVFNVFSTEEDLLNHVETIEQYATGNGRTLLLFFKKHISQTILYSFQEQYSTYTSFN